jgi:hypothetical protein
MAPTDEDTKITGDILEWIASRDPCTLFTLCSTTFTSSFFFNGSPQGVWNSSGINTCTKFLRDPWGVDGGLRRSSQYEVFLCFKMILMSFYEDKEEESEEDIEFR